MRSCSRTTVASARAVRNSTSRRPLARASACSPTAASLAVQSGANVKTIQRMLGHTSAAMTLDVYSDLFDDDLDDVATALDRAAHASAAAPTQPQPPNGGWLGL